jgi:hypothetical protein
MQKSQPYRTSPAYRSLKALCKEIEAQFRSGKEKNRGAWTIMTYTCNSSTHRTNLL